MAWTFLFSSTYIKANNLLASSSKEKKTREFRNRIWTADLNLPTSEPLA